MITEKFLEDLGIQIASELESGFTCYCPFHSNTNTPAMYIDSDQGLFICYSADCEERGNLVQLIIKINHGDIKDFNQVIEAKKFIAKHVEETPFIDRLKKQINHEEMPLYDQNKLDEYHKAFPFSPAHSYMVGRGFTSDTLKKFKIGYRIDRNIVTVPLYDHWGRPLGYVGRSIEGKKFDNSWKLPSRKAVWNLHNARKYGSKLILTEASFDAMRIDQAGYPNVGAILKGHLSKWQVDLIERYFTEVIMFADNEPEGVKLGIEANRKLNIPVKWCNLENYEDLKDASDMTDDHIRRVLSDIIPHYKMMELLEIPA